MKKTYLLISCEISSEDQLSSVLSEFEGIKSVMITYGDYDIVVEAETENEEEMDKLITTKIRRLEKIRSTITLRVTD